MAVRHVLRAKSGEVGHEAHLQVDDLDSGSAGCFNCHSRWRDGGLDAADANPGLVEHAARRAEGVPIEYELKNINTTAKAT